MPPEKTATHLLWANHEQVCVQGGADTSRLYTLGHNPMWAPTSYPLFIQSRAHLLTCKARSSPCIRPLGPHHAPWASPRVCWTTPSATAQCTDVEPEAPSVIDISPDIPPSVGARVNVLPWIAFCGGRSRRISQYTKLSPCGGGYILFSYDFVWFYMIVYGFHVILYCVFFI